MTISGTESESPLYGLDPESRQIVIDMVGQLRKRLLTREKILEYDKEDIFPEEVIREMLSPDIGLQLIFIPEAYGGMGGGARDCCAITQEISKICLGSWKDESVPGSKDRAFSTRHSVSGRGIRTSGFIASSVDQNSLDPVI